MVTLRLRRSPDAFSDIDRLEAAVTDPSSGGVSAYSAREGSRGRVVVPAVGTFTFDDGSSVVTANVGLDTDLADVLDAYHGLSLPLVLQAGFGYEALHASGVRVGGADVVGFAGMTEAGKSTLAFGLASRGHELWADEAIAFTATADGTVEAVALPSKPKLRPQTDNHFLGGRGSSITQAPEWCRSPLRALFVLQRVSSTKVRQPVEIRPLGATEGLLALLPNGYRFRPLDREREGQVILSYVELVGRVPLFRLVYGDGLDHLPALLDSVEERIALVREAL